MEPPIDVMKTNDIQTTFDSLAIWEQDLFIENNAEQLITDLSAETPNLDNVNTEIIVEWLLEKHGMTTKELLDAVVDDVEELREIMEESAIDDYENQEEIVDEDEYTSDRSNINYEPGEDSPF